MVTVAQKLPDAVILFDGVCNLCAGYVQFVIRRDPNRRFRFASLQSATGRSLSDELGLEELSSVVLILDGKAHIKSSAVIRICGLLRFPWPVAWIFWLVPKPVRNWCYDFIGKRRYAWFGKKSECWVPNESLMKRFIE